MPTYSRDEKATSMANALLCDMESLGYTTRGRFTNTFEFEHDGEVYRVQVLRRKKGYL